MSLASNKVASDSTDFSTTYYLVLIIGYVTIDDTFIKWITGRGDVPQNLRSIQVCRVADRIGRF
jgi:hypothetical protein